jgi:pimeloyl-ACP methyl ester carboxylesterase
MDSYLFTTECTKTTHKVSASYPRFLSTVVSPETRLEVAVDEYIIHNATNGATLLFTHGTSFNKKLWEPTIKRLLQLTGLYGSVSRILAIDATNHGESWSLNAMRLTSKCEPALEMLLGD